MTTLDSIEKSAQRVYDYLHDPAAFGKRLNANRRKRLMSMLDSLSDSIKILEENLGIDKSDDASSIDAVAAMVAKKLGIDANDSSESICKTSDKITVSKCGSGRYPSLPRKACGAIYKKLYLAILSGSAYQYDSILSSEFASLMLEIFELRFKSDSPYKATYNVFQISESIEQVFIAYAAAHLYGTMSSFNNDYSCWKNGVTSGGIKSLVPQSVLDYSGRDIELLDDDMKHGIIDAWKDLTDVGPYHTILRRSVKDDSIQGAFLHLNPFNVWNTEEQKGAVAATS